MQSILPQKQCDSVKILREIKKAIYIMRSDQSPDKYRFGGIGVVGSNTAVLRLGQCSKYDDSVTLRSWHYLIIERFPPSTTAGKVRECEIALREVLVGKGGFFAAGRTHARDEFLWKSNRQVVAAFRHAIRNR